jgi:hypothetical protein
MSSKNILEEGRKAKTFSEEGKLREPDAANRP